MADFEDGFIRSDTKDFTREISFDRRTQLNSVEQLILLQHKIKKKSSAMKQDPANADKVRRSQ